MVVKHWQQRFTSVEHKLNSVKKNPVPSLCVSRLCVSVPQLLFPVGYSWSEDGFPSLDVIYWLDVNIATLFCSTK